jgi:hypothetical protein
VTLVISRSSLGHLEEIAVGGMARIYRAPDYRLPGDQFDLVYKQYKRRIGSVPLHGLEQIVAVRERMHPQQRNLLDNQTTWPLRVIEAEGRAVGVLMRLIPDDFFQTLRLRSGKAYTGPRELQYLLQDAVYCKRVGVGFASPQERLAILRDFAHVLALLHKANVVYGDISTRNVIYKFAPKARAMLVDCDAVRVAGNAAIFGKQPHSPDWEPPEALAAKALLRRLKATNASMWELERVRHRWAVQNRETDVYKFGLALLRVLSPGSGGSVVRSISSAPRQLPREIRSQLELTLGDDPASRPDMRSWYQLLNGQVTTVQALTTRRLQGLPRTRGEWQEQPDGSWIRTPG